MRRLTFILILLAAGAGIAPAHAEEPRADQARIEGAARVTDQVSAATANAVEKIRADVEDEWLAPNLTVADFLDRTGAAGELTNTLRRAEQIGGPRWLDDQTCQVKLAIPGDRVAQALRDIATSRG